MTAARYKFDAQYTPDDVRLALMKPISISELMK